MPDEKNTGGSFQKNEIPGMFAGPILPVMVKLSLPIFTGMMFQLLYHIVDTIWVSRIDLSDPSYVGGTGIIYPIVFFAIAIGVRACDVVYPIGHFCCLRLCIR